MGSLGTTTSPDDQVAYTGWAGGRGQLFGLAFWTGLFTILTVGFYRFWARTRIRRWYWSSIRPGGLPLEYTGTPYEKLLGFLIAVVILAFYLGVVNLILIFASFSFLAAPGAGYLLTFLGVIPLWFFASYRAQRYLLARTRWMGIRFGLEPGAWGYALRACWHWFLTLVSFGMWHPRLRWSLARYRHDRTWFGSQKMEQGGDPTMLYPAFIHVMIGGFLTVGTLAIVGTEIDAFFTALESEDLTTFPAVHPFWKMFFVSVPWLIYGLVHYSVDGRKRLIGALNVGDIGLDPRPRPRKMLWIIISGNVIRYVGFILMVFAALAVLAGLALAIGLSTTDLFADDGAEALQRIIARLPEWASIAVGALFYFTIFLIWNVLTQIFLNFPIWRHYAETLRVTGLGHVTEIAQRARDESREAGGFAEALDVGAAI